MELQNKHDKHKLVLYHLERGAYRKEEVEFPTFQAALEHSKKHKCRKKIFDQLGHLVHSVIHEIEEIVEDIEDIFETYA